MTETTEVPAAAQASPKGKKVAAKKTGSKKASAAPSHPPISQMVNAAIRELKERGGSSTQAIKKYISSNYKIDVDKKSKFIGKYLKSAVTAGTLVQTKGKGASGSFKLAGVGEPKPKIVSKEKRAVKTKKPAAKKAVVKAPPAKKASPSKAKKAKKPPTTPKPPKPKAATKAKAPPAKPKSPKKKKAPAAAKKKTAAKKK